MLDVRGFPFKAIGRRPMHLGWRAAFPVAAGDEKVTAAVLAAVTANCNCANQLSKARRRGPSPLQRGHADRGDAECRNLGDDEVLRDRLKEAGIGTPATRAEIIGGLKSRTSWSPKERTLSRRPACTLYDVLKPGRSARWSTQE